MSTCFDAIPRYSVFSCIKFVKLHSYNRYTIPGDIVVDPFCGVGTTAHAAMLLGRQGVGLDIDPNCMFSIKALHSAIYGEKTREELHPDLLFATPIGAYFQKILILELQAETRVWSALETRHRAMVQGKLTIKDVLLVATQMHTFRDMGMIFLRFCHDLHKFGDNDLDTPFLKTQVKNSKLCAKEEVISKRPCVDTFEGLSSINKDAKDHIQGFKYRALYLKFHKDERYPAVDPSTASDSSFADDDEDPPQLVDYEEMEESEGDEVEVNAAASPISSHLLHLHSAAQAEGSPRRVQAFEEKMREVEERKSMHSQDSRDLRKDEEEKKKKKKKKRNNEQVDDELRKKRRD